MKDKIEFEPIFLGFYMDLDSPANKPKFKQSGQSLEFFLLDVRIKYTRYLKENKSIDSLRAGEIARIVIKAYQNSNGDFNKYMALCNEAVNQDSLLKPHA